MPNRPYAATVWVPTQDRRFYYDLMAPGPRLASDMARRRAGSDNGISHHLYDVEAFIRIERLTDDDHACPAIRYYRWNGRVVDFYSFEAPRGWR